MVTFPCLFRYNAFHMVSDRLESLSLYRTLAEGIMSYMESSPGSVPPSDSYSIDRERTVIFIIDKGRAVFSTSWRETPDSKEPSMALEAGEGDFVLFLPGEPFLVKTGDASVRMYRVA